VAGCASSANAPIGERKRRFGTDVLAFTSPRQRRAGKKVKTANVRKRGRRTRAKQAQVEADVIQTEELDMVVDVPSGSGVAGNAAPSNGRTRPEIINNGIKMAIEVFVPGASQFLEGRVGSGAAFAIVGLGGPALVAGTIAPIAPVVAVVLGVAASIGSRVWSYSSSLKPESPLFGPRFTLLAAAAMAASTN
jgi:hypothetical protein